MTRTLAANLVDECGDFIFTRGVWLSGDAEACNQIAQLLARQGLMPGFNEQPALDAPHAGLGANLFKVLRGDQQSIACQL
ncbi:hypothetical protein CKO42_00485 [Lamprobacter modestohalophilus]|uniref:Uncharacterized protein n=1 Tax=Lamprobacter modestohalophilus TaxID=1064514 RepID=A0A9X0W4Q1_9GAMM|nr:hypothetical protein [Lamprobacter modestohalophilus]